MHQEGSMKPFKQFYEDKQTRQVDNWDKVIASSGELQAALEILDIINKRGSEALIVGGAVRDIILGREPHDVDIATNMDMPKVADTFKSFDIGKSQDFGIVAVPYKGYTFEIAHYREEFGTSDARHPDEVRDVDSFEQDSARRDITINSLGLDADGTIIDYQGGLEDIKNGLIRAVGNPDERIKEDALRIIRALRFAAKFGFDIEPETKRAVQELGHMLFRDEGNPEKTGVSAERLHDELFKMAEVGGPALADFLDKLDEVGLLDKFLPEVKAMQGVQHQPEHHPEGDVGQHVQAALRASKIKGKPITTLAILFHDIGKPGTYELKSTGKYPDGKHTFYGHDKFGVGVFHKIANRLRFSRDEKNAISFVIQNHMKPYKASDMKPSKLLSLKNSPYWEEIKDVLYADIHSRGTGGEFAKGPEDYANILHQFDTRTQGLGDREEIKSKLKGLVDGHMIMQLTGATGPEIGRIKDQVEEWILNNKPDATREDVEEYIKSL
jgi:tRNA nucleotidyltransferase/poly(A) polymerase